MKVQFTSLLLTLATLSLFAQEQLVIDKVVAKVGTETILLSDVEAQYAFAKSQPGEQPENLKCEILQAVVGQKLVVHHARLDSVIVSPEEIETSLKFKIDGVLSQMNGSQELFKEYYGMTVNEMKDNLREDLEQQMLAERMQSQIINNVVITPKEVKAFFNEIPKDSIPYLNAEVELAELVVKPLVNSEERSKALQQAVSIRKEILNNGADFAEMAKKYSDDPGSGRNGGDLGFAERGFFVQEFEAAAYALDEMEISDPIESDFGFHLIQLLERRGNKINVRHILITPEITEEDKILARENLVKLRERIINDSLDFATTVKKHSLEELPSYSNNGMMIKPNTRSTIFETSELPYEIYIAIDDKEVNDITEPLELSLPNGETYYRILKLMSKSKPHKASLETDYTKIQRFAKESKKSEYFAKWLEDKLANTFIKIDANYLSCPDLNDMING